MHVHLDVVNDLFRRGIEAALLAMPIRQQHHHHQHPQQHQQHQQQQGAAFTIINNSSSSGISSFATASTNATTTMMSDLPTAMIANNPSAHNNADSISVGRGSSVNGVISGSAESHHVHSAATASSTTNTNTNTNTNNNNNNSIREHVNYIPDIGIHYRCGDNTKASRDILVRACMR